MVMVERGGCSFGRELGLGRVARGVRGRVVHGASSDSDAFFLLMPMSWLQAASLRSALGREVPPVEISHHLLTAAVPV